MEPKVANLEGCHSIFHHMATNAETFSTTSKSAYPNHRPPGLNVLEKMGMDSVGDVSGSSCSCRLPPYQITIPKCPYPPCNIHIIGRRNAKSLHLYRHFPLGNPCRTSRYSLLRCHSGFSSFSSPAFQNTTLKLAKIAQRLFERTQKMDNVQNKSYLLQFVV